MPGQGSPPPKPASFLATLLKRGAPAMATATSELSDEVSDPTPMRAIRRVSAMAAPVDPSSQDGLLLRAGRFVAVVPMAYRLISVPGALFVFLGAHGGTGAAPVIVVAVLSVALNLYGFRWLLRPVPFRNDRAAALLLLDGGFTVLANLAVAALVPPEVYVQATAVPGKHLLGAVALFTLALGLPYGLGLALGSIPLNLLMGWASTGQFTLSGAFAGLGTLLGVLLTGTGALVLVGLGTRLALAYGIRNGREAERARQHRMLHDTVLQTLEVMALPGSGPAEERVAELRRAARAASVELRQTIEASEEEASRPLGEKLASLAAEMARDGLRAQVVIAEMDEETLSYVRQIAVRDAVREAMRNTMKHSGTDKVLVRVEERDGGIAVITRDHGAGFSSDTRPPGFGISESITARLAEVGGKAKVESTPGSGTRVTLWVPC